MRVLVCGGRDFADRKLVFATLDRIHGEHTIDCLIEGGARGADRLAYEWARTRLPDQHIETYPADWTRHGKSAGPIRNRQMLESGNPDLVVVFPGGSGTAHMVKTATAAGVTVIHPTPGADDDA